MPTSTTSTPTRGTSPPPTPPTPASAGPPRGAGAEGGAGADGRCPGGWGTGCGAGAAGTGAGGGAGAGGTWGPALEPGPACGLRPPGEQVPLPGGGGVWVAELGLLGDHQGDEEPALRCQAPSEGRGEPGGALGRLGNHRGPKEGPLGRDLGGLAQQGADVAAFPGGGGASRMRGPTKGCPGPCTPPSPTGATAGGTNRRRSSAPTQAATQVTAAPRRPRRGTPGIGEEPVTRDTPPAGPAPPTQGAPPTPPTVWRGGGARAASSRGESGNNERGGGGVLSRSTLTANHQPEPPPPAPAIPPPRQPARRGAAASARRAGRPGVRVEGGRRRVRPPPR